MSQLPEQQLLIHKKRQDHLTKMLKRNTGNVGNLSGIKGFKFFAPEEDTTSWEVRSLIYRYLVFDPSGSKLRFAHRS